MQKCIDICPIASQRGAYEKKYPTGTFIARNFRITVRGEERRFYVGILTTGNRQNLEDVANNFPKGMDSVCNLPETIEQLLRWNGDSGAISISIRGCPLGGNSQYVGVGLGRA